MFQKVLSFFLSIMMALFSYIFPEGCTNNIKAKLILNDMTLEQKIGQMMMPEFRSWEVDGEKQKMTGLNDSIKQAIEDYGFGGVILFTDNCQGTEQVTRLVYDMQQASSIPMLIGIDQEGGYITRLRTGTGTVGNMALGAINDYAETKADAQRIASELSAIGINTDFAPDMDVNCNPSNPVIGIRSFSSSADIVANMGTAFIEGMHAENIATSIKHFPGHGDTATDSHTGLPLIDKSYHELKKTELVPFKAGIAAGTDMVMTTHIVFPQIEKQTYTSTSTGEEINLPATLSKTIITDILREDMGYDGVVTTDAMNMAAIAENFTQRDAAVLAINAGVDILLMPVLVTKAEDIGNFGDYIDMIADAVNSGEISIDRINESVMRILKLKLNRGIINDNAETVSADEKVATAKQVVGSKANHEAEFKTAEKAITILKNDNVLPLKASKDEAPLFLYPYDGEENSIVYGIDRAKNAGSASKDYTPAVYLYRYKTVDDFTAEIEKSSSVVVFTESYSASYINPESSVGWQSVFVDALIEKAHGMGKKVTVVSLHLPYDIARYIKADALVLAYGAKDMQEAPTQWNGEVRTFGINIPASVSVILGGAKPQGKAPIDIPEITANYKYSTKILYPVGYGLELK